MLGPEFTFSQAIFTSQANGSVDPGLPLEEWLSGRDLCRFPVPLYLQKANWQDPNQRTSYVEQASFGPQLQLNSTTVLELNWVGNWGHKMNRLRNANQGAGHRLSPTDYRPVSVCNPEPPRQPLRVPVSTPFWSTRPTMATPATTRWR